MASTDAVLATSIYGANAAFLGLENFGDLKLSEPGRAHRILLV